MIALGIILCIGVIGLLCWLLFTLAVYALPFFAGMTVGLWAHHSGAGPLGGFVIGAIVAGATLAVGQLLFVYVRSIWARLAIALIFAAPAALAGFQATHGLTKMAIPTEGWRIAFSIVGALAVGVTAWARMMVIEPRSKAGAVTDA